jgi:hypothetical protein
VDRRRGGAGFGSANRNRRRGKKNCMKISHSFTGTVMNKKKSGAEGHPEAGEGEGGGASCLEIQSILIPGTDARA